MRKVNQLLVHTNSKARFVHFSQKEAEALAFKSLLFAFRPGNCSKGNNFKNVISYG